ncbi:GL25479 [Drosophila persimilis]|uniref:GL25479 n=1 Tax=Drosophila persimilis TaxID=7234 RepID=B4HBF9_DROPE|nr:GL25479 [Drosophila persimilis]
MVDNINQVHFLYQYYLYLLEKFLDIFFTIFMRMPPKPRISKLTLPVCLKSARTELLFTVELPAGAGHGNCCN